METYKTQYGGSINLIFGSMFSGKTSEIIRQADRYMIAKKKCIMIKWKGDNRYTDEAYVKTHSGLSFPCLLCDDNSLNQHIDENKFADYDVILIDEGSFFHTIVNACEKLANQGFKVIIASLIGTFQREPFNQIIYLTPKAESITMLTAICMKCFKDGATFTARTTNEKEVEIVGGSESYMSVCRECYYKIENGKN
jgi:thymidine kinase